MRNTKLPRTKEDFKAFIIEEMIAPRANTNKVQSWWGYASAIFLEDMPSSHAPRVCSLCRKAGEELNEEYGRDVIAHHFPGVRKFAGNKWKA